MNKVLLIGRLTKDIELKNLYSGSVVSNFTLAVSRTKQVSGQPDADFVSCVVWGKTAENMNKYLKKGSLIAVEGKLQSRDYVDQTTNKKVFVTEVLVENVSFLESKDKR